MKISLLKTSLIDYPGLLACVIFLSGCNFRCPYCHNASIVNATSFTLTTDELWAFLSRRQGIIEGVVISGGEPTIHKELIDMIQKIKELNYRIKLDTNGSNPSVIEKLIEMKLVDYIAMDIKGLLDDYPSISNTKLKITEIIKSIEIIKNSKINYEFRMTVIKEFHSIESFHQIGNLIYGAKRFCIQPYRYSSYQIKPKYYHTFFDEELKKIKSIMNLYVRDVIIKSLK